MVRSLVLRCTARLRRRVVGRSWRLTSVPMLVAATVFLSASPYYATSASAADSTSIFGDVLGYEWGNWSWGGTANFTNTSQVYSGARAISFQPTSGWSALNIHTKSGVSTGPYTHLSFVLRAAQNGQRLGVALHDGEHRKLRDPLPLTNFGGDPEPGAWKLYNIPLSSLNASGRTVTGVSFQDQTGKVQSVFYADQIQLVSAPVAAGATPTPTPSASTCGSTPHYEEIRPKNTTANMTAGRPAVASRSPYAMPTGFEPYFAKIDGQGCVGTTEQILEWAAKKWGFDELGHTDLAKAMAAKETWWVGTFTGDASRSWGILQVKDGPVGYWPDGRYGATSTAYGADYAMAIIRFHYDGKSWLGAGTKGSIRNAVGAFFCGCGYSGNAEYANKVFEYLNAKPWKNPGLPPYAF